MAGKHTTTPAAAAPTAAKKRKTTPKEDVPMILDKGACYCVYAVALVLNAD